MTRGVTREVGLSAILVAAFLIVVPFSNVAPDVFPWRFGVRDWRFGALGFFLSVLTMPTVGLGLLALGGALRESRRVLGLCFVLAGGLTAFAVPGLAEFFLDGMALRAGAADPRTHLLYDQGLRRTGLIALCALPALVAVAVGSRRAMKLMESSQGAANPSPLFTARK